MKDDNGKRNRRSEHTVSSANRARMRTLTKGSDNSGPFVAGLAVSLWVSVLLPPRKRQTVTSKKTPEFLLAASPTRSLSNFSFYFALPLKLPLRALVTCTQRLGRKCLKYLLKWVAKPFVKPQTKLKHS